MEESSHSISLTHIPSLAEPSQPYLTCVELGDLKDAAGSRELDIYTKKRPFQALHGMGLAAVITNSAWVLISGPG